MGFLGKDVQKTAVMIIPRTMFGLYAEVIFFLGSGGVKD